MTLFDIRRRSHQFDLFDRAVVDTALSVPAKAKDVPYVSLYGAELHAVTEQECTQYVFDSLASGRGGWCVTLNMDHLRRYVHESQYRALCEQATLRVADGMPLVWASKLQGTPLPERVAGSDLIWHLSDVAAQSGRSVFLLGGDEGTADAAATVLCETYPDLHIAGTHCPPLGFEQRPEYIQALIATIKQTQPDIVYIALGSPKQEVLISQLRPHFPPIWWFGVGISFSFICGQVARAPHWIQRLGFEWLHRLVQEPRRLASRYLRYGIPFFISLTVHVLSRRFSRR